MDHPEDVAKYATYNNWNRVLKQPVMEALVRLANELAVTSSHKSVVLPFDMGHGTLTLKQQVLLFVDHIIGGHEVSIRPCMLCELVAQRKSMEKMSIQLREQRAANQALVHQLVMADEAMNKPPQPHNATAVEIDIDEYTAQSLNVGNYDGSMQYSVFSNRNAKLMEGLRRHGSILKRGEHGSYYIRFTIGQADHPNKPSYTQDQMMTVLESLGISGDGAKSTIQEALKDNPVIVTKEK